MCKTLTPACQKLQNIKCSNLFNSATEKLQSWMGSILLSHRRIWENKDATEFKSNEMGSEEKDNTTKIIPCSLYAHLVMTL